MTDNEEINAHMLRAIMENEGLSAADLENVDMTRADEVLRRMQGEDLQDILEDMNNGN